MKKKRVAVHELRYGKTIINQAYIDLCDGKVLDYGCLHEELPMTEWLGGTIVLKREKGGVIRAFWNGEPLK